MHRAVRMDGTERQRGGRGLLDLLVCYSASFDALALLAAFQGREDAAVLPATCVEQHGYARWPSQRLSRS